MYAIRHVFLLMLVTSLTACATGLSKPSPAVLGELAPTGKLRVGVVVGNIATPALATKNTATGAAQGVAIDLAGELAQQLGVALEVVPYPTPAKLFESVNSDAWDVTFLVLDPVRAKDVDFSPPYTNIGNTYLVAPGSKIGSIADIDRPGIRVAVSEQGPQDLYLTKSLKHAELVRAPGPEPTFQLLVAGKVDAFAHGRPLLLGVANKLPGSRVLDGSFSSFGHAMAVPKGRPLASAYIRAFIEQAMASGSVRRAIDRAGLLGVDVP